MSKSARSGPAVAIAAVLLLVVGIALAVWLSAGSSSDPGSSNSGSSNSGSSHSGASNSGSSSNSGQSSGKQPPQRVSATLALIDAGQWPAAANAPGTRGGTRFGNNEGLLPKTGPTGQRLTFQEWDVNPKKPNRGRDAERIITANDGSAWYTLDHYRTFVQIRGPA